MKCCLSLLLSTLSLSAMEKIIDADKVMLQTIRNSDSFPQVIRCSNTLLQQAALTFPENQINVLTKYAIDEIKQKFEHINELTVAALLQTPSAHRFIQHTYNANNVGKAQAQHATTQLLFSIKSMPKEKLMKACSDLVKLTSPRCLENHYTNDGLESTGLIEQYAGRHSFSTDEHIMFGIFALVGTPFLGAGPLFLSDMFGESGCYNRSPVKSIIKSVDNYQLKEDDYTIKRPVQTNKNSWVIHDGRWESSLRFNDYLRVEYRDSTNKFVANPDESTHLEISFAGKPVDGDSATYHKFDLLQKVLPPYAGKRLLSSYYINGYLMIAQTCTEQKEAVAQKENGIILHAFDTFGRLFGSRAHLEAPTTAFFDKPVESCKIINVQGNFKDHFFTTPTFLKGTIDLLVKLQDQDELVERSVEMKK